MKECFFCNKSFDKLSLEHSIPQFLGGKGSDDKFKRLNLCGECNSKLGLTIDAKFARSFHNAIHLNKIFDDFLLPFSSIDLTTRQDLRALINDKQSIEMCLGNGITGFWLKENNSEFEALSGGNPIKSKQLPSKIFIFINEKNNGESYTFDIIKSMLTEISKFFKKYKRIELLLCVDFVFEEQEKSEILNFFNKQFPHEKIEDKHTLKLWHNFSESELEMAKLLKPNHLSYKMRTVINFNDYVRFLSKLFLGILCGYLSNDFVNHKVGKELITIMKTIESDKPLPEKYITKINVDFANDDKIFFGKETISIVLTKQQQYLIGILEIDSIIYRFNICSINEISEEMLKQLNINSLSHNPNLPTGILLRLNKESGKYEELSVQEELIDKALNLMKMPRNQQEFYRHLLMNLR